jgi:hypothetical protein
MVTPSEKPSAMVDRWIQAEATLGEQPLYLTSASDVRSRRLDEVERRHGFDEAVPLRRVASRKAHLDVCDS